MELSSPRLNDCRQVSSSSESESEEDEEESSPYVGLAFSCLSLTVDFLFMALAIDSAIFLLWRSEMSPVSSSASSTLTFEPKLLIAKD